MANGWKGQRISIFPDIGLVVTMTGVIESDEAAFYDQLVSEHVLYSIRGESLKEDAGALSDLQAALGRMREKRLALESVQPRMVPEEKNKARRIPWHD